MTSSMAALLRKHARQRNRPDGTAYQSLLQEDEIDIAARTGMSRKEIQLAALRHDIIPERYCRNQRSLGCAEQAQLLGARVVIIGQGGLGGTVTEILARIGIGYLSLIDGDIFEESNLNRQLLSSVETLGKKKAEIGRQRVQSVNPAVEVDAVCEFLTEDNCTAILKEADVAVDCLDSITSRFILENGCRKLGIPLVSAAIGGAAGQAMVIYPEDVGISRVYGAPEKASAKGVEKQLGTLPYAAVFMAAIECAEIVSILCRGTSGLRDAVLIANVDDKSMNVIPF